MSEGDLVPVSQLLGDLRRQRRHALQPTLRGREYGERNHLENICGKVRATIFESAICQFKLFLILLRMPDALDQHICTGTHLRRYHVWRR